MIQAKHQYIASSGAGVVRIVVAEAGGCCEMLQPVNDYYLSPKP